MKALLIKLATEIALTGVSPKEAARAAGSLVASELTKAGMTVEEAYDAVFGNGFWKNLSDAVAKSCEA